MGNYYNIEELKSVKITDILRDYGVRVNKSGFFSLRNERTPSCKIYAKTNSFYDFGNGTGGNPINLVETLERCTRMEAMDKLASMYGIEPVNRSGKGHGGKFMLTDSQYKLIGIQADKATKNMVFDMELDFEELERISAKYMMPMNELKERYLPVYETIISSVAVENVELKRHIYKKEMHYDYIFRSLMKAIEGLSIPSVPPAEEIVRKFGEAEKELNRVEKVMGIACQKCKNIKFKPINHDAAKEYRTMVTEMAEMDLQQLRQIQKGGPDWIFAFNGSDKGREFFGLPKEHNSFFKPDYENAERKIAALIRKDAGNVQKEIGNTMEK